MGVNGNNPIKKIPVQLVLFSLFCKKAGIHGGVSFTRFFLECIIAASQAGFIRKSRIDLVVIQILGIIVVGECGPDRKLSLANIRRGFRKGIVQDVESCGFVRGDGVVP